MSRISLSNQVLIGRLLTRSGDQAWDFAVPLVLLHLLPNQLRIAALYYLIIRIVTVFVLPKLAQKIDRIDRYSAAKFGTSLQLAGVIGGLLSVLTLEKIQGAYFQNNTFTLTFIFLVLSGIISQLGSVFMDISIANDLIPSCFEGNELSRLNSRLRQIDLFTEVGSPVLTGFILLLSFDFLPLFGFTVIAFWNVLSFFPELLLLNSIFKERPDLKNKPFGGKAETQETLFNQLKGWRLFFKEPVALIALTYAILWLSVLSPHGVLLTSFLKDGWQLPETTIGVFRGLGALFGLAATFLFPFVLKFFKLEKASLVFLIFQTVTLLIGLFFFFNGNALGQILFLGFILLSRIGLYGFSLGEMQIRQERVPPHVRGEINGFANALTALATIGLFGAGVILPSTDDFKYLVVSSVLFVCLALAVYVAWHQRDLR